MLRNCGMSSEMMREQSLEMRYFIVNSAEIGAPCAIGILDFR
jgi:hypothetical protein